MVLPPAIRPDFNSLFKCLLSSRADSTVKKYLKEINKFLLWCRTRKIALQLPFSSSVVALHLVDLDQQLRSAAAMVLVHAALKWFHSFVPDDGASLWIRLVARTCLSAPRGEGAIQFTRKSSWTLLSLEVLLTDMALRKHL